MDVQTPKAVILETGRKTDIFMAFQKGSLRLIYDCGRGQNSVK